jgi:hypothetical protein
LLLERISILRHVLAESSHSFWIWPFFIDQIFKGFYDLYLESACVQALSIFKELAEIGHANQNRLAIPHLEWAVAQTKHLIRSHTHHINIWVRDVCDKHVYDPNEDIEEKIFWRKWQAPLFLIMTPSLYTPYDAAAVWDREDAESSSKLLQHFAEHYVLHLEVKLRKAAGAFAMDLAKRPISTRTHASDSGRPSKTYPIRKPWSSTNGPRDQPRKERTS